MRRGFVLRTPFGKGRPERLAASALAGCALLATLLIGPPSANAATGTTGTASSTATAAPQSAATRETHRAAAAPSAPRAAGDAACAPLPVGPFGGPGDPAGSGTVESNGQVCRTFTTTAGTHLLVFGKDAQPDRRLLDPTGNNVTCENAIFGATCALVSDGTYTLVLENVGSAGGAQPFQVAVYRLANTEGCGPDRGTGLARITMQSPVQVDCRAVDAEPGDRLKVFTGATTWLINGSGTQICLTGAGGEFGCALTGPAPYRIVSSGWWDDAWPGTRTYSLQTQTVRDTKGCPLLRPGRYNGWAAGALAVENCRVLIVPAAARYRVELVDEKNNPAAGQILDGAGKPLCDTGWCSFPAAGRYKLLAKEIDRYATVFLPEAGTSQDGCEAVSDDPAGPARNLSFYSVGQHDCLVLPTPAGAGLTVLGLAGMKAADFPVLAVYDATGTSVCDLVRLTQQSCLLQGTAPFRVMADLRANADEGNNGYHDYKLTFARTNGASTCPVLEASAFGSQPATNAALKDGRIAACFTVPQDQHAGTEVFSFSDTESGATARLTVFGNDGRAICRTATGNAQFALCHLDSGPVTVFVEGSGSFAVARRDVTGSAAGCRQVGSTAVGAPAVTGTVASGAEVHCYQVAAVQADTFIIGAQGTGSVAKVIVLDPTGAHVGCGETVRSCSVTGSTGYQVLVWGGHDPGSLAYELDVWKVWTAAGPPKECAPVPSSAYGFGPYTGTLNDGKQAACVTATRGRGDDTSFSVTNPNDPNDQFTSARLYAVTNAAFQSCTGDGPGRFTCPTAKEATEPTVFVLTSSPRSGNQPYRWEATCAKPLCGDSRFTVTAVAPSTVATGGIRTITLTGTSLHQGDTVRVTPAGQAPITATVKTVSADRTTMTADVDLTGAAAGKASIEVASFGAKVDPARLADALTITAPVLQATKPPAITGQLAVGGTVTATPGTWTPAPTSYAYQWAANGIAIKGATSRTYLIPAAVLGKRLTVTVTASRTGANPGTGTSAPSAPIAKGTAPKATKKPQITGTAKVGKTVRAGTGAWTLKPTAYRYEWRLNGKLIAGASRATLKLTKKMAKKKLTVTVIAVKPGHTDGKAPSKAVTVRK